MGSNTECDTLTDEVEIGEALEISKAYVTGVIAQQPA